MRRLIGLMAVLILIAPVRILGQELRVAIERDYEAHLADLFTHFHRNPELSLQETETAARMAQELAAAGFEVTEGVGGTGVVGILRNGAGPVVMVRADMDALPIEEKSDLPYASTATWTDPQTGEVIPVMHACGHDVHLTSLVGTARQMAQRREEWRGTLMLVAQPAEERILGAKAMKADGLWERFGQPDVALAFHVQTDVATGRIAVLEGSALAGADEVDIVVRGVGAHGASPHLGKDPIVLASQIVVALQTLVSRELSPRARG